MSPVDLDLFPKPSKAFKGKHFEAIEEISDAVASDRFPKIVL